MEPVLLWPVKDGTGAGLMWGLKREICGQSAILWPYACLLCLSTLRWNNPKIISLWKHFKVSNNYVILKRAGIYSQERDIHKMLHSFLVESFFHFPLDALRSQLLTGIFGKIKILRLWNFLHSLQGFIDSIEWHFPNVNYSCTISHFLSCPHPKWTLFVFQSNLFFWTLSLFWKN